MSIAPTTTAEDYKLHSHFAAVRDILLKEEYQAQLGKTLAYWTLPTDRRLPLTFLDRTLGDLLQTPFSELQATPGIGAKKVTMLVELLHRAATEQLDEAATSLPGSSNNGHSCDENNPEGSVEFDSDKVSEAVWTLWRETAHAYHLGDEMLGRLAPTLQDLPTVIWQKKLGDYLDCSLAEIRQMKTHGEKRVRVLLEVFHSIHSILSNSSQIDFQSVRLTLKFVPAVEKWIAKTMDSQDVPSSEEMENGLFRPLLKQIELDAGEVVHQLAAERLGVGLPTLSVRVQSQRMGVTRARIYQMLEDCAKIFDVRWPEGKLALSALAEKLASERAPRASLERFRALCDLLYPEKYDPWSQNPAESSKLEAVLN